MKHLLRVSFRGSILAFLSLLMAACMGQPSSSLMGMSQCGFPQPPGGGGNGYGPGGMNGGGYGPGGMNGGGFGIGGTNGDSYGPGGMNGGGYGPGMNGSGPNDGGSGCNPQGGQCSRQKAVASQLANSCGADFEASSALSSQCESALADLTDTECDGLPQRLRQVMQSCARDILGNSGEFSSQCRQTFQKFMKGPPKQPANS